MAPSVTSTDGSVTIELPPRSGAVVRLA